MEHAVQPGDIWRMCQTSDLPIRDWVKLAVNRARATGHAAIFWLDESRAYDRLVIAKARKYLEDHDTTGLDIRILSPVDAIKATLERVRRGAGHHLGHRQRAARLPHRSVPDPRAGHQRQDAVDRAAAGRRRPVSRPAPAARRPSTCSSSVQENYLRWDSLGEFLALAVSIEDLGLKTGNARAVVAGRGARSRQRPGSSSTTSRRSARSARSTIAAATSTWRCTGRARSPSSRKTRCSA